MNARLFLAALLLFGGGLLGAWIMHYSTPVPARGMPSSSHPTDVPLPTDAGPPSVIIGPADPVRETERLLAETNRGEALEWLTEPNINRGVAQWGKEEAIGLINQFYLAGAVRVFVVDTETVGETEVASQFIIELPTDPAPREKVFKVDASFESQYSAPPAVDLGQKYLHLTTD